MQLMVAKLAARAPLDPDDVAAILRLPHTLRSYDTPTYVVREGMTPIRHCSFILSGFAFRQKLTVEGARQIVSLHMKGDFLDLQHLFLDRADHNVQALTRLDTIEIERAALQELALSNPAVGRAMWVDALVEASVYREWVLNIGRRDARQRIAHLLCEFSIRMQAAGIGKGMGYDLPMTQEQLGDALGLTSVHVNRTLKVLVDEGVVSRDRRHIRIADWNALAAIGDFSALYLHLDQATG